MKVLCDLKGVFTVAALVLLSLSTPTAKAQPAVVYDVSYQAGQAGVSVTLTLPEAAPAARFTIPRSAPGTYQMTNYAAYFSAPVGTDGDGQQVAAKAGLGSYFDFQAPVKSVSWFVDIGRMEQELVYASTSSKLRDGYLGMLGYSVFGYVSGYEANPVVINLAAPDDWPIFSTLSPTVQRPVGKARFTAENFAALADGQYLLGDGVRVWSSQGATNLKRPPPIPVFVAAYAETDIDIGEIGRRGVIALNGLNDYFGFTPMPFYTLCYEFLEPRSPAHVYRFSMEHLNSMTASLDIARAVVGYQDNPRLRGIVHHMGHSWIPLRSYGEGYRPFEWETAPLIDTIWLNEGFIWYVAIYKVLGDEKIIAFFERFVTDAPDFIRNKSLRELSLLGSTQYATDMRIGANLFSRGALLARDLDEAIAAQTDGRKSLRDALANLYDWTAENQRAFKYEEILPIMSEGLGVDLSDTWQAWHDSD